MIKILLYRNKSLKKGIRNNDHFVNFQIKFALSKKINNFCIKMIFLFKGKKTLKLDLIYLLFYFNSVKILFSGITKQSHF